MGQLGTEDNPLWVAIIGSGPSAFFAAGHLFNQKGLAVRIDMFDRLLTPYGLVRGGVAPDHQKIKLVTATYEKIAAHPSFRFFGNVEFGRDVTLPDLRQLYHQIIFATGAETDRHMGIPGEDLAGSYSATEFVAWYNGRPDYRHCQFDLSAERAAVIGVGNVAVDVCRILCRTIEELKTTDIADYALDALRESRVKEVYMVGRRGPAQAAFSVPELEELEELPAADLVALPAEAALDALTLEELGRTPDRAAKKKAQVVERVAQRAPAGKPQRLVLRFFLSPVEILGDERGHVAGLKVVKNVFRRAEGGRLELSPTGEFETLPVGLVFRSIGYQGVPLPDVPFDQRKAVIPNDRGRVLDPQAGGPLTGVYAVGWIKRGPTGVIGTNKPDAHETVDRMMEDLRAGAVLDPGRPEACSIETLCGQRQLPFVSYQEWLRLDQIEVGLGKEQLRPRIKFTRVEDMLTALGRTGSNS